VKAQIVLTVVRDAGLIVVGLGGIIYQQVTNHVNVELLLVYTTMLGIPGAVALLQLSRGKPETPTTAEPSSSSPRPQ
jgi:hypothetical protein